MNLDQPRRATPALTRWQARITPVDPTMATTLCLSESLDGSHQALGHPNPGCRQLQAGEVRGARPWKPDVPRDGEVPPALCGSLRIVPVLLLASPRCTHD